ncbi:hypothetical protein [Ciceribacter thiooxidans]|uniref:Uncharacterized protein n=1 Tax=Ciceribacter thiooxidans TaxID=1969821 RepID=A0ABV7I0Q9_9HYPH|nr:hypothetical protein [Ciceribacter thiooxidans]
MLSLADFFDHLRLMPFRWKIRENNELSGIGDARVWQAAMAPELWSASVTLRTSKSALAEAMAARIRALRGARDTFLFRDPFRCFPASDPGGAIIGASTVTVQSVGVSLNTISLAGLPAGYRITTGDKLQVTSAAYPDKVAFLEFSTDAIAAGNGVLPATDVFPNVPPWVAAGNAAVLVRPACKCVIVPGSVSEGTVNGSITAGQGFQIIQKK